MNKHVLLSATAIAALLAGAATLSAQERQGKEQDNKPAPSQSQPAPKAGGGQNAAERSKAPERAGGGAASERQERAEQPKSNGNAGARQAQEERGKTNERASPQGQEKRAQDKADTTTKRSETKSDKNRAQTKSETDKRTAADKKSGSDTKRADDQSRTSNKNDNNQTKNRADNKDAKDNNNAKDRAGAGASATGNDQPGGAGRGDQNNQAQRNNEPNKSNERMGQKDRAGETNVRADVRLDDNNRTRFVETIRRERVTHIKNPKFNVSIGTRIPRSVRLYSVPAAVYAFAPSYRNYRYVVVDDRVCIIDPATYEIVYVVDDGGSGAGHSQRADRIDLTRDQQSFILSRIDQNHSTTRVRLRLALGAQVPNAVELVAFSDDLVSQIPELRDYRYVVADGSVLIVDPDNRDIMFVIRS